MRNYSPSGASSDSRANAGVFGSRRWLDKPLPVARNLTRRMLAAAEPALSPIYWAALAAKSSLEDQQANREGDYR